MSAGARCGRCGGSAVGERCRLALWAGMVGGRWGRRAGALLEARLPSYR